MTEKLFIPQVGSLKESSDLKGNGAKSSETLGVVEDSPAVEVETTEVEETNLWLLASQILNKIEQELAQEERLNSQINQRQELLNQVRELDRVYIEKSSTRKKELKEQEAILTAKLEAIAFTATDYEQSLQSGLISEEEKDLLDKLATILDAVQATGNSDLAKKVEANRQLLHHEIEERLRVRNQEQSLAKQEEADYLIETLASDLRTINQEIAEIENDPTVKERLREMAEKDLEEVKDGFQKDLKSIRENIQSVNDRINNTLSVFAEVLETDVDSLRDSLLNKKELQSLRDKLINAIKAGRVADLIKLQPWNQVKTEFGGYDKKMNKLRNAISNRDKEGKEQPSRLERIRDEWNFGSDVVDQLIAQIKSFTTIEKSLKAITNADQVNIAYIQNKEAVAKSKGKPDQDKNVKTEVKGETIDPLVSGKDIPVEVYELRGHEGQYRHFLGKGTVTLQTVKAKGDGRKMVKVVSSTDAAKENLPQGKLETAIDPKTDFSQAPDWLKPIVRQFIETQENKAE